MNRKEKEEFILQDAIAYLEELNENDDPKWGRMTPQHMLEHLGMIFLISSNKVQAHSIADDQQKEYYENLISGHLKFKQNTASPALPKDPLPLRFQDLDKAKEACYKAIKGFGKYFEKNPDEKVEHPVFGELNYDEWLYFHEIHLKHHLKQFDLIK
jgi:oxepin-CoA hydrolase/3-oxo-5,6-dehydrosuberyl-CoA semialdehyde dehydrogenase